MYIHQLSSKADSFLGLSSGELSDHELHYEKKIYGDLTVPYLNIQGDFKFLLFISSNKHYYRF